jgi:hypothetical protein
MAIRVAGRKHGDRDQGSGRRDKTSLSTRSPLDSPALASSPTISTADATSSGPPGGCTGPLTLSLAHSKPCVGTRSRSLCDWAWRLGVRALGLPALGAVAGLRA